MNTCELFSYHFNKEEARKALKYQLERVSNNENQATSNVKDAFHFFVKSEGSSYANEKRAMFIGRIYCGNNYKNLSYSGVQAKLKAEGLFKADTYFKYESLDQIIY
jgi:hypothetical protein